MEWKVMKAQVDSDAMDGENEKERGGSLGRGEVGEFQWDLLSLKCISSRRLNFSSLCLFPLSNIMEHLAFHIYWFNNNIAADSPVFNRYLLVEMLLDQSDII